MSRFVDDGRDEPHLVGSSWLDEVSTLPSFEGGSSSSSPPPSPPPFRTTSFVGPSRSFVSQRDTVVPPASSKYEVVVGKVLQSSTTSSAPQQQGAMNYYYSKESGEEEDYDNAYQSDRIPSKPLRRCSSEGRAKWEAMMTTSTGAKFNNSHAAAPPPPPSFARQTSSSSSHPVVIEVAPGLRLRLRGSQETWEAISRDFYLPLLCWGCNDTIFVIQDAAYVICPTCRTVSPADGTFEHPEISGVGLGFTYHELNQWQQQITASEVTKRRNDN